MTASAARHPWIFSARVDLFVFTLPALLALSLIGCVPAARESPDWVWLSSVLCVDVAHVWSSAFVTYWSPAEIRRHPARYGLIPALGWGLGVLVRALGGAELFWRCLAHLAVFHFVRQQYGWMALYRARAGERERSGAWIDGVAIYAATLYPLVYWHCHLPRRFDWFMPGDFLSGLPPAAGTLAALLYVGALSAYAARAIWSAASGVLVPWGKHLLLLTTAATWYVGIVATNSDYAFTISNVLVHGIPYGALVFSYGRHVLRTEDELAARLLRGGALAAGLRFLACIWLLAYFEELLWDRCLWHEHPSWFGRPLELGRAESWLVPLLALPQLTHYVLDGVFWRRTHNSELRAWFAHTAVAGSAQLARR